MTREFLEVSGLGNMAILMLMFMILRDKVTKPLSTTEEPNDPPPCSYVFKDNLFKNVFVFILVIVLTKLLIGELHA